MSATDDVSRVLAELKEQVRHREQSAGSTSFSQPSAGLRRVHETERVNPHLPIGWPNLPSGLLRKASALLQKVVRRLLRWYINPIVEQQNAFNTAVSSSLESLVERVDHQSHALEAHTAVWHPEHDADHESLTLRLQRLERLGRQAGSPSVVPGTQLGAVPAQSCPGPALDYFGLELKFRRPHLIRDRYARYLKHFSDCQDVLDIGCGRGEFVEMLLANGISARGVDLNPDAVAAASERNLPVELAEASSYLGSLPNGSLGGVFAAQVVEHLEPEHLARLLQLCFEKMKEGAPIILETLNPSCIWAMVNWFVVDPTHVWPIHVNTLKFLLESAGFHGIEIEYSAPVPLQYRLLLLSEQTRLKDADAEAVALLNRNFEQLNEFLYGYQEYCAIAHRPMSDARDVT